jgi:hypothetical protein
VIRKNQKNTENPIIKGFEIKNINQLKLGFLNKKMILFL